MGWKKQASSNAEFELPPAGNHPAVLVALVDIGTHEDDYGGKITHNRKVYLAWELTAEDNRPVVCRDFTFSLNSKALLRTWIKNWRGGKDLAEGEEFDVSVLLGKPCMLQVSHQPKGDRTFYKLDTVATVPRDSKGKSLLEVPAATNNPVLWSVDDGDTDDLPDWLPKLWGRTPAEWVESCQEVKGKKPQPATAPAGADPLADDNADNCPF